jgi:hypothetical protein
VAGPRINGNDSFRCSPADQRLAQSITDTPQVGRSARSRQLCASAKEHKLAEMICASTEPAEWQMT